MIQSLFHGLSSETNVTSARIFLFKANKSLQRSYTTMSCSQMPGASNSALLGDIMLIK